MSVLPMSAVTRSKVLSVTSPSTSPSPAEEPGKDVVTKARDRRPNFHVIGPEWVR
jgi:hypothetical protein